MFDSPIASMVVEILSAVYQLLFWLVNAIGSKVSHYALSWSAIFDT